jgi:hypothetical protein
VKSTWFPGWRLRISSRNQFSQAVRDGYLMQDEADRFTEIHDRLVQAGVMQ